MVKGNLKRQSSWSPSETLAKKPSGEEKAQKSRFDKEVSGFKKKKKTPTEKRIMITTIQVGLSGGLGVTVKIKSWEKKLEIRWGRISREKRNMC